MSNKKNFEGHALNLGKLTGNLLSIEMAARIAIVKLDKHSASQVFTELPQVKEGDQVESNAFTNADDLRKTLEKYNKYAPNEYKVDVAFIVGLRDALAHGRTFGFGNIGCLRLLKFKRKKNNKGRVTVEVAQDMTDTWFNENIKILDNSLKKISVALDYEIKEFK